jgi:hypothetical protein
VYLTATGLVWLSVLLLVLLINLLDSCAIDTTPFKSAYSVLFTEVPNRVVMLAGPITIPLYFQLKGSSSGAMATLALAVFVVQALLLSGRSIVSVMCAWQEGEEWLRRGLDPALLTKKGMLLNHAFFVLRVAILVVAAYPLSPSLQLAILSGLTLLTLLGLYLYSGFRSHTQRLHLLFLCFFSLITVLLFAISMTDSVQAKTVLSGAALVLFSGMGLAILGLGVVSLWAGVNAWQSNRVEQEIEMPRPGVTIDQYWQEIVTK